MDRRIALLAAVALVVVVGVVALVAVGGEDDADVVVDDTTTTGPEETTTTTEPTTTTTSTTVPDQGEPVAVAVDADGRVVVLDIEDGDVDRVLLEGIAVDDPAKNGIAVAPERGEVFVTRPERGDEPTELVKVALDGSGSESLGEGIAPSVSPDESFLAYVRFVEREVPLPAPVLVIRELDTGEERVLAREDERDFHFIPDTAWTADGDRVAFVAGEIVTGLYLVDADAETLDDAERIGPPRNDRDASWSAVTAFGEDTLAVVERCCDVGASERWLVLAVDVSERTAGSGLLPDERVEASFLDSPTGERRLLYVTDVRPGGGTLHRWDGSDDPEVVSDGIVVAAW